MALCHNQRSSGCQHILAEDHAVSFSRNFNALVDCHSRNEINLLFLMEIRQEKSSAKHHAVSVCGIQTSSNCKSPKKPHIFTRNSSPIYFTFIQKLPNLNQKSQFASYFVSEKKDNLSAKLVKFHDKRAKIQEIPSNKTILISGWFSNGEYWSPTVAAWPKKRLLISIKSCDVTTTFYWLYSITT